MYSGERSSIDYVSNNSVNGRIKRIVDVEKVIEGNCIYWRCARYICAMAGPPVEKCTVHMCGHFVLEKGRFKRRQKEFDILHLGQILPGMLSAQTLGVNETKNELQCQRDRGTQ